LFSDVLTLLRKRYDWNFGGKVKLGWLYIPFSKALGLSLNVSYTISSLFWENIIISDIDCGYQA
jgi:hypothetical protein